MKTQLRKNFHSISLKCIFPNKSFVTMQMGYSDTGGRGQGVTQAAFDGVMAAFAKAHAKRFENGRFASNGDFIDALNAKLESDAGIADPITLAQKIEEFAA
jgi:hypothetical protein